MTTPIAGFPSITALANRLEWPMSKAWKRVTRMRCAGVAITLESVRDWKSPPRKYEPSPVKRIVVRSACAALARQAGCTPGAMRLRLKRGKTPAEAVAMRPQPGLSSLARAHGLPPELVHQRVYRGALPEEAVMPFWAPGLISAAKRARPGKLHGGKLEPGADIRRHLAAGLTLAEALDAETAAAWARIEARAA